MRFLTALILSLTLSACQQASRDPREPDAALEQAKAEISKLEIENAKLEKARASAAKATKISKPTPPTAQAAEDEYDPEIASAETTKRGSNLCWQDYCPCDETVTALDKTICRNARGGIEMSDDQWAIGAQARDSKREGDRLSREMDDIISDMHKSR